MKKTIQYLTTSLFLIGTLFLGCGGNDTDSPVFTSHVQPPQPICVPDSFTSCYTGDFETLNVGACKSGLRRCLPDGFDYGECEGEIVPEKEEICNDMIDNDCDGITDKDCYAPCEKNEECAIKEKCRVGECQEGYCAIINLPSSTKFNEVLYDCKSEQCDGSGNLISVNSEFDFQKIDCYYVDCKIGNMYKEPMEPGNACSSNGGKKCDGMGNCMPCTFDIDCMPGQICVSFQCI